MLARRRIDDYYLVLEIKFQAINENSEDEEDCVPYFRYALKKFDY